MIWLHNAGQNVRRCFGLPVRPVVCEQVCGDLQDVLETNLTFVLYYRAIIVMYPCRVGRRE